jgi:hypothetical protein
MAEFVHFHHSNDEETEKHFKRFKKLHLKDYKHHHDNERRKHIFKHNLRYFENDHVIINISPNTIRTYVYVNDFWIDPKLFSRSKNLNSSCFTS